MRDGSLYYYWENRHDEDFYKDLSKEQVDAMAEEIGWSGEDFLDFSGSEESVIERYKASVWKDFAKYVEDVVPYDEAYQYQMVFEMRNLGCRLAEISNRVEALENALWK